MRHLLQLAIVLSFAILAIGCSNQATDTAVTPPVTVTSDDETAGQTSVTIDENGELRGETSDGNGIALTPENTLIQFVGTHVGPTPDPKARTGKFQDFTGKAVVADDELKSVSVEIQMASVDTGQPKLNNHLQAEDFFNVREYPTAKFESTTIVRNEDGDHIVTGNLTLHSKTNEISFPASVGMTDGDLNLTGKLELDRTEFGMDQNTEKVNKEVNLTIAIGKQAG